MKGDRAGLGGGGASQRWSPYHTGRQPHTPATPAAWPEFDHQKSFRYRVPWTCERMAGPPGVPADLLVLVEELDRVRREKEAAIDAGDFEKAAALRDTEKQLLTRLAKREQEWTVGVDLAAVIQENHNLHGEVERLRELLRQHGIEPNGGTAQTA